MRDERERKRGPGWLLILICCTLAVPMVGELMGYYENGLDVNTLRPAFVTGALLGIAHLILRPILRLIFSPLGCLTLGLFGLVIDLGLIYLSASFVEGFAVPSFLYALLTALLINFICAFSAGRRD